MPKHKKKEQPKNALYYFATIEVRKQLQEQYRPIPSIMDLISLAHPQFQKLTEEEKNRWKNIAKKEKDKLRADLTNVFTASGKSVADLVKEQQAAEKQEKDMKNDIETTVQNLLAQDTLLKEKFYILDFNIYVVTEEQPREYVPAEMTVVELSLERGVIRKMHRIIKPGEIPRGYMAEAMTRSNETHKLTFNAKGATANYVGIIIELRNFINPEEKKPKYPPLYVMPEHLEKCDYILNWMYERCEDRRRFPFKLYDLPFLLHTLQHFSPREYVGFYANCVETLEKSTFDYTMGMECQWHHDASQEDEDMQVIYCSQSKVMSKAYLFLDSCCHYYNVRMLANKHCPEAPRERPFVVVSEIKPDAAIGPPETDDGWQYGRKNKRVSRPSTAASDMSDAYSSTSRSRGPASTWATESAPFDDTRSTVSQPNYRGHKQSWGGTTSKAETSTEASDYPPMNGGHVQPWGETAGEVDTSTVASEYPPMGNVQSAARNYGGHVQPWGGMAGEVETSTVASEFLPMSNVQPAARNTSAWGMQRCEPPNALEEEAFPSLHEQFKQVAVSKKKAKTPKTKGAAVRAMEAAKAQGTRSNLDDFPDALGNSPNNLGLLGSAAFMPGKGRGGISAAPPGFAGVAPTPPELPNAWAKAPSMGRGRSAAGIDTDSSASLNSWHTANSSLFASVGRGSKISSSASDVGPGMPMTAPISNSVGRGRKMN